MPSTLHTLSLITLPCCSGLVSTCWDTATVAQPNPGEQQGQTHAAAVAKGEAAATGEHCLVEVVHFAPCMTVTAVSAALLLILLLSDNSALTDVSPFCWTGTDSNSFWWSCGITKSCSAATHVHGLEVPQDHQVKLLSEPVKRKGSRQKVPTFTKKETKQSRSTAVADSVTHVETTAEHDLFLHLCPLHTKGRFFQGLTGLIWQENTVLCEGDTTEKSAEYGQI